MSARGTTASSKAENYRKAFSRATNQEGETEESEPSHSGEKDFTKESQKASEEEMGKDEAKKKVNLAKRNANKIFDILAEVKRRNGHIALEYKNFTTMLKKEFTGYSIPHLTRLISAAEARRNIGSRADGIVEGVLRPLYGLEPDKQLEAFRKAELAAGSKTLTAQHMQEAADLFNNKKKKKDPTKPLTEEERKANRIEIADRADKVIRKAPEEDMTKIVVHLIKRHFKAREALEKLQRYLEKYSEKLEEVDEVITD